MSEKVLGQIVTPEFRFLFPNLWEAKPFMKNGKPAGSPVFGTSMLFVPAVIAPLKAKVIEVALAKWPGRNLGAEVAANTFKLPFHVGDKLAEKAAAKGKDGAFYKGTIVIKATSKFQPQVLGPDKNELLDKSKPKSGDYGYAEINFVAYDGVSGGSDGVTGYLNFVMVSRPGDRIAGRDAKSAFAGISGGSSDHNPLDDDIPF